MKRSSKEFKTDAREALIGNYGTYIGTYLIYALIAMIVNLFVYWYMMITGSDFIAISGTIISFLFTLLMNLLKAGLFRSSLSVSRRKPISVGNLFYGLTHHPDRILVVEMIKSLVHSILSYLATYFYMDIMYDGFVSELYFARTSVYEIMGYALAFLAGLLLVGGIAKLLATVILLPLALSTYLLVDDVNITAIQSLKESARMMKGNYGRYLYIYYLSFIGHYCLAYSGGFIPLLWIEPYRQVTLANLYRELRQEI